MLATLAAPLVGCTQPVVGTPSPPGPFEIRLDDFDPCSVFTQAQLDQLGLEDGRFSPADEYGAELCQWRRPSEEGHYGFLVTSDLAADVNRSLANPRARVAPDLAGFPVIETQNPRAQPDRHCIVLVDVAPGQVLQVNFDYNGDKPMARERACAEARTAAELAMQTLIARHRG